MSRPLAATQPPYALHMDLPYTRRNRESRDRGRTNYGIPLPPPGQSGQSGPSNYNTFATTFLPDRSPGNTITVLSPRAEERGPQLINPQLQNSSFINPSSPQPNNINTITLPAPPPVSDGSLENRLAVQDRNIEMLLDRAIRIKEDLVVALGSTNSGLQEERFARDLLQQHVNVMVLLCQKLSQQIEFIYHDLNHREVGSNATISTLRELELSHVHNITDVKGKTENLEISLSHLDRDLNSLAERGRYTEKQCEATAQQNLERYFGLDGRLGTLSAKVEANFNEAMIHIRGIDKSIDQHFTTVDAQIRSALESMRGELTATKAAMQAQVDRLESSFQQAINHQQNVFTAKLRDLEKNAQEAIAISNRQSVEYQKRVVTLEHRLKALEQVVADQVVNIIEPKFAEMKEDMQHTFQDVHEAIQTLEHVEDGKIKMLDDRIAKEVDELRKFVVLV